MTNNIYQNQDNNTINNINNLLYKSSQILACDTECQYKRKEEKLKMNYEKAKENILYAPEKLDIATKQYYTYIGGDTKYDKYQEQKYENEVNNKIKKYQSLFHKSYEYCNNLIQQYNAIIKNTRNTFLLYDDYILENKYNKNNIEHKNNTIFTNQRKTYYEMKQLDIINNRHFIFVILYFILLFIYFILLLVTDKPINAIIILFLLGLYPFVIPSIIENIINIVVSIINYLPVNVYLTL